MSESKFKLQQEVERMSKIVREAALLMDVIDSMDYDDPARSEMYRMTDRLRKAMYGQQQG